MNLVDRLRTLRWQYLATELQRARHRARQSSKLFARLIAEAKKAHDLDKMRDLQEEDAADTDGDRATVDRLVSLKWERRAVRNWVPLPERVEGEYWEPNGYFHRLDLTTRGVDYIERQILEKKKQRRDLWLPFVTALIGIIGAATGLVSILKK